MVKVVCNGAALQAVPNGGVRTAGNRQIQQNRMQVGSYKPVYHGERVEKVECCRTPCGVFSSAFQFNACEVTRGVRSVCNLHCLDQRLVPRGKRSNPVIQTIEPSRNLTVWW